MTETIEVSAFGVYMAMDKLMPSHIVNSNDPLIPHDDAFFKERDSRDAAPVLQPFIQHPDNRRMSTQAQSRMFTRSLGEAV